MLPETGLCLSLQNPGLNGLILADQYVISLCPQPHNLKSTDLYFSVSCHQRYCKHRDRSVRFPKEVLACTDTSFLGHAPQPPLKVQVSPCHQRTLNQQRPSRASTGQTTHKHLFSKRSRQKVSLKNEVRRHCSWQKSHLETFPQAWGAM